ncbi:MAG TPA: sigma-70 family RNA polymerase sigma factor [Solirubrobacterales bacterium]
MSESAPGGIGVSAVSARLLSDDRLVRRATKGDEWAFAAIYSRYDQDLQRFCLAIVGNPQDAQDALQNTMVKVMRGLPGERRQLQLKPWLYRIAHNESVEVLRRRSPTVQLDPHLAAAAPSPVEAVEQRARLQRLVVDMGQLPERQRAALVMRELAGLGFDEIGAALDTSPAVARQTLYEARLSMRQMNEGRELSCEGVMRALSDADGRVTRRRDLRAHLRECSGCREFGEELRRRRADFAALAPLPVAIAGASALGTSVLAKSAATVAVVAAIGVTAADRGGLVDIGLPGGGATANAPAHLERPRLAVGDGGGDPVRVSARSPSHSGKSRSAGGESGAPVAKGVLASHPSVSAPDADPATPEPVGGTGGEMPPPLAGSPAGAQDGADHSAPAAAADPEQQAAPSPKGKAKGKSKEGGHPLHPVKPEHPAHGGPALAPDPATGEVPPQSTSPIAEGGPGNSENAPGHSADGPPGHSVEGPPGHSKHSEDLP